MVRVVPTEGGDAGVPPPEGQETEPSDESEPAIQQQQTPATVALVKEGGAAGTLAEGREVQPSGEGVHDEQQSKDDLSLAQNSANTYNGAPAGEESNPESDATRNAPGASDEILSQPGNDMAPVDRSTKKGPESEEMQQELDQGSAVPSNSTQGVPSILDMDKDSGITTFSLRCQDDLEPSLPEGDGNIIETMAEEAEEEDDEEDSEFAGVRLVRQQTGAGVGRARRKLDRQNTGVGGADGLRRSGGKKKKAPFQVPQTMYMGHPLGSAAADFLERQHHRISEVKTRRDEVAGMVKLVMEHKPKGGGSALPDVDAVFPYRRERDQSQGDWCV